MTPTHDEAGAIEDRELLDDGLTGDRQYAGEGRRGRLTLRQEQVEQVLPCRIRHCGPERVRFLGASSHALVCGLGRFHSKHRMGEACLVLYVPPTNEGDASLAPTGRRPFPVKPLWTSH